MKHHDIAVVLVATVLALSASGVANSQDSDAYQQFTQALEQRAAKYEANGGAWPQVQDSCALCHGENGRARNSQYASLAGLPAAYLEAQLRAFAVGRRTNAYMNPYAASLGDDRIRALAEFYARQSAERNEFSAQDPAVAKIGADVVAARACSSCHGDRMMGGPAGPRLAGQGAIYLADQLRAYRQGERQDPTLAMNGLAATLSDEQIETTAAYLAGLDPAAAGLPTPVTK